MGGSLAVWLAEHHPDAAGLITVNALIRHPRERAMRMLGLIGLPRWVDPVANDIKLPDADECAYDKIPSRAARQLALLLAAVRRDLASVSCPALIFSSLTDHVVPPANQRELYAGIGSADKKLVELPECYHVATMDYEKELIFAETLKFVSALSAARRDPTGARATRG